MFCGSLPALKIIQYPHPTLRYKSKPVKRVDKKLKMIVAEMFELMYEARGLGLAANQVDLPLQLFVINLACDPDKSEEEVYINPVLSKPKGVSEAEEGCLSIVGVNARVARPQQIHISAYDLQGNPIDKTVDGLLGRAIQHECDHLNGVLFIDRLSDVAQRGIAEELNDFVDDFISQQSTGAIQDNAAILKKLIESEAQWC